MVSGYHGTVELFLATQIWHARGGNVPRTRTAYPKRAEIGYGSASAGTAVLSPEVRRTPRTASAPPARRQRGTHAPVGYSAGHAHMTAYLLAVAELEYGTGTCSAGTILYCAGTKLYCAGTKLYCAGYNFVSGYPFFLGSARSDVAGTHGAWNSCTFGTWCGCCRLAEAVRGVRRTSGESTAVPALALP